MWCLPVSNNIKNKKIYNSTNNIKDKKTLILIDENHKKHYKVYDEKVVTLLDKTTPNNSITNHEKLLISNGNSCESIGYKKGGINHNKPISVSDIIKTINHINEFERLQSNNSHNISNILVDIDRNSSHVYKIQDSPNELLFDGCILWSRDINQDGKVDESDLISILNILLFYQITGNTNPSSSTYICNIDPDLCQINPLSIVDIPYFDGWGDGLNLDTHLDINISYPWIINDLSRTIEFPYNSWNRGCPNLVPNDLQVEPLFDDEFNYYTPMISPYINNNMGCSYENGNYTYCYGCNWDGFWDNNEWDEWDYPLYDYLEESNYPPNTSCCTPYPHKRIDFTDENGDTYTTPDWYSSYNTIYGNTDDMGTFEGTMNIQLSIDGEIKGTTDYGNPIPYNSLDNSPSWCCDTSQLTDIINSNPMIPPIWWCSLNENNQSDVPSGQNIVKWEHYNRKDCEDSGNTWVSNSPFEIPVIGVFEVEVGNQIEIDNVTGCKLVNPGVNNEIDCSNIVGIFPRFKSSLWNYGQENFTDIPPYVYQNYVWENVILTQLNFGQLVITDMFSEYPFIPNGESYIPDSNNPTPPVYSFNVDLNQESNNILKIMVFDPLTGKIHNGGCTTMGNLDFLGNHSSVLDPYEINIITDENYNSGCPILHKEFNGWNFYETCNYDPCSIGCNNEIGNTDCCTYQVCNGDSPLGVDYECVIESEISNYPWEWIYYTDCDGDGILCNGDGGNSPFYLCPTYTDDEYFLSYLNTCGTLPKLPGKCVTEYGESIPHDGWGDDCPASVNSSNIVCNDDSGCIIYLEECIYNSCTISCPTPTAGESWDGNAGCDPREVSIEVSNSYCTHINGGITAECQPVCSPYPDCENDYFESGESCDCVGSIDSCGVCGGTAKIDDHCNDDECDWESVSGETVICNFDQNDSMNFLDCNCVCNTENEDREPNDPIHILDNCGICKPFELDSTWIYTCYEDEDGDDITYTGSNELLCCENGIASINGFEDQVLNQHSITSCQQNENDWCPIGYSYNPSILPECNLYDVNGSSQPLDDYYNQYFGQACYDGNNDGICDTYDCELDTCDSNTYDICSTCRDGYFNNGYPIPNCLVNNDNNPLTNNGFDMCGSPYNEDVYGQCATSLSTQTNDNLSNIGLWVKDECNIDGLNNTCQELICNDYNSNNLYNNFSSPNKNPCKACDQNGMYDGLSLHTGILYPSGIDIDNNLSWNSTCADCNRYPCKDGLELFLTDASSYPKWYGYLKYQCTYQVDVTGSTCCNIEVIDECGVCNGSDTKTRWFKDTDGDGYGYGEGVDFCGRKIIPNSDGEDLSSLGNGWPTDEAILIIDTPPWTHEYNEFIGKECLINSGYDSPYVCWTDTCDRCVYGNPIWGNECTDDTECDDGYICIITESSIVSQSGNCIDDSSIVDCYTSPIEDLNDNKIVCIDDYYAPDCSTNFLDICNECCNPDFCLNNWGDDILSECEEGSNQECDSNNECPYGEICFNGVCKTWDGRRNQNKTISENWERHCNEESWETSPYNNRICNCTMNSCPTGGCGWISPSHYFWDLDGDGNHSVDDNFYLCDTDEILFGYLGNIHLNQFSITQLNDDDELKACQLNSYDNYICCEFQYYCTSETDGVCMYDYCKSCSIKDGIDNYLTTDEGYECMNIISETYILLDSDYVSYPSGIYYTSNTMSAVGTTNVLIGVSIETPNGYDISDPHQFSITVTSGDVVVDVTYPLSLYFNNNDNIHIHELDQEDLNLDPGEYTVNVLYPAGCVGSGCISTDSTNFTIEQVVVGCISQYSNTDDQIKNCNYNSNNTHDTFPDSSCIPELKYYPDSDGDGIPCTSIYTDMIYACPTMSDINKYLNDNYIDINDIEIGYSDIDLYGNMWFSINNDYAGPPQDIYVLDEVLYGNLGSEPSNQIDDTPICATTDSAISYCNDKYNITYSTVEFESIVYVGDCYEYITENSDWELTSNESNTVIDSLTCLLPPYVWEEWGNEYSEAYCECPFNSFDDCGICRDPQCTYSCSNGNSAENPHITCGGYIMMVNSNPCTDTGYVPDNPNWNKTCTGCKDPSAVNYNENNLLSCIGTSNSCRGTCEFTNLDDNTPEFIESESRNIKIYCDSAADCVSPNGEVYGNSCIKTDLTGDGFPSTIFSGSSLTLDGFYHEIMSYNSYYFEPHQLFNDISIGINNGCNINSQIIIDDDSVDDYCGPLGFEGSNSYYNCNIITPTYPVWKISYNNENNLENSITLTCSTENVCDDESYSVTCIDDNLDMGNQGSNCCCEYDYGCTDELSVNYNHGFNGLCYDGDCNRDCTGTLLTDCLFSNSMSTLGTLNSIINPNDTHIYVKTDNQINNLNYYIHKYIKITTDTPEFMLITDISQRVECDDNYTCLELTVQRGLFGSDIQYHMIENDVATELNNCEYSCCAPYSIYGCIDEDASNYYCNLSDYPGSDNDATMCMNGNIPIWNSNNKNIGHIQLLECSDDNNPCNNGSKWNPLPGENLLQQIKTFHTIPIQNNGGDYIIDSAHNDGDRSLSHTFQGHGHLIVDGAPYLLLSSEYESNQWKYFGWNNNFDYRFGENNWEVNIVRVENSPVDGLEYALKITISGIDGCSLQCGWGGLYFSDERFNTENNHFSSWIKVNNGIYEFGHLNTQNFITYPDTNNEWVFISSDDESPSNTQNGIHVYANATDYFQNGGSGVVEIEILTLFVTDQYNESSCCCNYWYDCHGRKIESSDTSYTNAGYINYDNDTVSYYDNCGTCVGGTSTIGPDIDSMGCGCFRGDTPIWYYDLDCPDSLDSDNICDDGYNAIYDGYGCTDITIEWDELTDSDPWEHCLPYQSSLELNSIIPAGYIHPTSTSNDINSAWADGDHPGWISYESDPSSCECSTNLINCMGNCIEDEFPYYVECPGAVEPPSDATYSTCGGNCMGCDTCGICHGENRDIYTCENDPICHDHWLWVSISDANNTCNWSPDGNDEGMYETIKQYGDWPFESWESDEDWLTNTSNYNNDAGGYDCNCECDGDAFINDCGYCVNGGTGRADDYGIDSCGFCRTKDELDNGKAIWISNEFSTADALDGGYDYHRITQYQGKYPLSMVVTPVIPGMGDIDDAYQGVMICDNNTGYYCTDGTLDDDGNPTQLLCYKPWISADQFMMPYEVPDLFCNYDPTSDNFPNKDALGCDCRCGTTIESGTQSKQINKLHFNTDEVSNWFSAYNDEGIGYSMWSLLQNTNMYQEDYCGVCNVNIHYSEVTTFYEECTYLSSGVTICPHEGYDNCPTALGHMFNIPFNDDVYNFGQHQDCEHLCSPISPRCHSGSDSPYYTENVPCAGEYDGIGVGEETSYYGFDLCGVCGGDDSSCTGSMDSNSLNYGKQSCANDDDPNGLMECDECFWIGYSNPGDGVSTIHYGECTIPGLTVDCHGVVDGDRILDPYDMCCTHGENVWKNYVFNNPNNDQTLDGHKVSDCFTDCNDCDNPSEFIRYTDEGCTSTGGCDDGVNACNAVGCKCQGFALYGWKLDVRDIVIQHHTTGIYGYLYYESTNSRWGWTSDLCGGSMEDGTVCGYDADFGEQCRDCDGFDCNYACTVCTGNAFVSGPISGTSMCSQYITTDRESYWNDGNCVAHVDPLDFNSPELNFIPNSESDLSSEYCNDITLSKSCEADSFCTSDNTCPEGWMCTSMHICVEYSDSYCAYDYCGIGDGNCTDDSECNIGICGETNCYKGDDFANCCE